MTKQQRMIQRGQYLHDVHSRQGDAGWHRVAPADFVAFWLALVGGLIVFLIVAVGTRI